MKNDLLIRADGSTEIGWGHLVRCISLAQILRDDYNIEFVCKELPDKIEHELESETFGLSKIVSDSSFFGKLNSEKTVVLDGYHFDLQFQKKIRDAKCKLVIIDDLHDRRLDANLIINHAPGITEEHYCAKPFTKYALGLDYALLRSPFLKAASKVVLNKNKTPETLLICFGGSDRKNLTIRTLKVVSDFKQFKKIIIITGSSYRFKDELLREVNDDSKIEYHHALSGEQMADAFLESDVAIVPSSGILFEALATGNISISGTYTDNQKEVYSGFKELNAIIDAGEFNEGEIIKALQKIGTQKTQKKLIDGKSPERIRTLFQTIIRD